MPSVQEAKSWIKLSIILLTSISLLLWGIVVTTVEAEENVPHKGETICKELKPFNNLDELLYQFYVNLVSDCLFDMPVEELQTIWHIQIFARERAQETGQFLDSQEIA